jgi:ferredoxin
MSDGPILTVQSDPTLLSDLRRYGKFDTSGCYQCGSCTLTCDLVTDTGTFPRKIIRYVLLGLREPLAASLEPWLCQDCGDCSLICPRQAEPRISMMTVRSFLSAQYDWTRLSGKVLSSRAWHVGLLSFMTLLTLGLIVLYHLWYVHMPFSDFTTTALGLEHMFPLMTYYTVTVLLLPLVLLLSRIYRIWRLTMRGEARGRIPYSVYAAEAWTNMRNAVMQLRMRECADRSRWRGHWLLAFGTALMLSIKLVALRWFQTDAILAFYHPQRWLGYLAAACIVYGIGDIFAGRIRAQKVFHKETRFEDLIFPILLLSTALSGMAVHVSRYAGFGLTCHFLYALHVVIATPMLLVELPFGRWSHMLYRPLALYFEAVKERAARQIPAEEAVPNAA